MAPNWHESSARELARAVRAGECSAAELVEASLARIAATDGSINAFTSGVLPTWTIVRMWAWKRK